VSTLGQYAIKKPPQPQHCYPAIADESITLMTWYKDVEWFNITFAVFVPIWGMIKAYWTPLKTETAVLAVFLYVSTGLSITAGMLYQLLMLCGFL
jgi:hypothetical protein